MVAAMMMTANKSEAQMADGSFGPNFVISDINSVSQNLYTYLDQGYTVFLDFSAVWCGPCWSYHGTGALEDLYVNHGPAGMSGVSGATTDDVMVIWIEADGTSTMAEMNGTGGTTQGDWVTGTPFPMILTNDGTGTSAVVTDYEIGYFPTIYKVCPNRSVTEVGQLSATALYNTVGSCPAAASSTNVGDIFNYTGTIASCGSVDLKVNLQNMGTNTLTSATIEAKVGATVVASFNWTGSLDTYEIEEVTIGNHTITSNTTYTITVTLANSVAQANSATQAVTYAPEGTSSTVTVKMTTDRYGSETTWKIFNSSNAVVGQGGPYGPDLSANGTTVQPDVVLTLPNDCYRIEVYDSYGDGMCCAYGAGGYQVLSGATSIASGGTFATLETDPFQLDAVAGVEEVNLESNVSIYPNPVADIANVNMYLASSEEVTLNVHNAVGQVVYSINKGQLSAGTHNMTIDFSSLESGFYFVNVTVGTTTVSKKITSVK